MMMGDISAMSSTDEMAPLSPIREDSKLILYDEDDVLIIDPEVFGSFKGIILNIIKLDPFVRYRKNYLMKAFVTWGKCAPLVQHVKELRHQLQERTQLFEALRESYLKDVISVKYHLERIAPIVKESAGDAPSGKLLGDLKILASDMSAVPSLKIRGMVERANRCPEQTSVQLMETLENAGLIDKRKGRELNPWEQSKAYTSHLAEHETPLPVDEEYPRDRKMVTLTLHSPNTHKVYVQYCKACIGMMHFVHTWNREVEAALEGTYSLQRLTQKFEKTKEQVRYLTQVIKEQEEEIYLAKQRNLKLEQGQLWIQRNAEEEAKQSQGPHLDLAGRKRGTEESTQSKLDRWQSIAMMAGEDMRDREREINERWSLELSESRDREIERNHELTLAISEARAERALRFSMQEKLEGAERDYEASVVEKNGLKRTISVQLEEIKQLLTTLSEASGKYSRYQKDMEKVFEGVKASENKLIAQNLLLQNRIDNLSGVREENVRNEAVIDDLKRENKKYKQDEEAHRKEVEALQKEIEELKAREAVLIIKEVEVTKEAARKASMKQELMRKISVVEAKRLMSIAHVTLVQGVEMHGRPDITLRAVAIAVCCSVRVLKAFRTGDFRPLGTLGLKMRLNRVKIPDMAPLQMALDDEKNLTKTLMAQIQDKNATLEDLRQKNRSHQKKIGTLIETNEKKDLVIEEKSEIIEKREKLIVGLKRNILIVKGNEKQQRDAFLRHSVCQAEISNRLAKTLFFVRAVVHTVNPSVLLPKGTVAGTSEEIEAERGEVRREKELMEEREKEILVEEEKEREKEREREEVQEKVKEVLELKRREVRHKERELRGEETERMGVEGEEGKCGDEEMKSSARDERRDVARNGKEAERSVSKVGSRESLAEAEDSAAVSFAIDEMEVKNEGERKGEMRAGSRYLSDSLRVQALKDRWRESFMLFLEWAQTAKGREEGLGPQYHGPASPDSIVTPFKSPLKLFGLKRKAPDRRLKRQISEHIVIQESGDAFDDDAGGIRLDGEEGAEGEEGGSRVVKISTRDSITEIVVARRNSTTQKDEKGGKKGKDKKKVKIEDEDESVEEEVAYDRRATDRKISEEYEENQNICSFLKNKIESDVRALEKLVHNLRSKDAHLHTTITQQAMEIERLNVIIRTEPEIAAKGRNLLMETIEGLRALAATNSLQTKKIEDELAALKQSELSNFEKLVRLYTEIKAMQLQLVALDSETTELKNENHRLVINDKTKQLEKAYIEQESLERQLGLLNISRSDILLRFRDLQGILDSLEKEKYELLIENAKVKADYDLLVYKNATLKEAIADSYRVQEREAKRLLKSQYEGFHSERKSNESVLLRINNREVFVRKDVLVSNSADDADNNVNSNMNNTINDYNNYDNIPNNTTLSSSNNNSYNMNNMSNDLSARRGESAGAMRGRSAGNNILSIHNQNNSGQNVPRSCSLGENVMGEREHPVKISNANGDDNNDGSINNISNISNINNSRYSSNRGNNNNSNSNSYNNNNNNSSDPNTLQNYDFKIKETKRARPSTALPLSSSSSSNPKNIVTRQVQDNGHNGHMGHNGQGRKVYSADSVSNAGLTDTDMIDDSIIDVRDMIGNGIADGSTGALGLSGVLGVSSDGYIYDEDLGGEGVGESADSNADDVRVGGGSNTTKYNKDNTTSSGNNYNRSYCNNTEFDDEDSVGVVGATGSLGHLVGVGISSRSEKSDRKDNDSRKDNYAGENNYGGEIDFSYINSRSRSPNMSSKNNDIGGTTPNNANNDTYNSYNTNNNNTSTASTYVPKQRRGHSAGMNQSVTLFNSTDRERRAYPSLYESPRQYSPTHTYSQHQVEMNMLSTANISATNPMIEDDGGRGTLVPKTSYQNSENNTNNNTYNSISIVNIGRKINEKIFFSESQEGKKGTKFGILKNIPASSHQTIVPLIKPKIRNASAGGNNNGNTPYDNLNKSSNSNSNNNTTNVNSSRGRPSSSSSPPAPVGISAAKFQKKIIEYVTESRKYENN